VQISLTPTTCERNSPLIYVNCPKLVNIENPKLYTVFHGAEAGIDCEFWSKNSDTWACDSSVLSVDISYVNTSLVCV